MATANYDCTYDCVVVGSGHAGSCAALAFVNSFRSLSSATGQSHPPPRVLLIDKCPSEWAGGNGYFTAGAFRTTHDGIADLLPLVCNAPPDVAERIDMTPYSAAEFSDDVVRLSQGNSNQQMVKALVEDSRDAVGWLREFVEVPLVFSFNRQAYQVDGRMKFWGGMVLAVENGGKGLIEAHHHALKREGVEVWFQSRAKEVLVEDDERQVAALIVEREGKDIRISVKSVILACGGFEASEELRVKHLGPDWSRAKVGTSLLRLKSGRLTRRSLCIYIGSWYTIQYRRWSQSRYCSRSKAHRLVQHLPFDLLGLQRSLRAWITSPLQSIYKIWLSIGTHGERSRKTIRGRRRGL